MRTTFPAEGQSFRDHNRDLESQLEESSNTNQSLAEALRSLKEQYSTSVCICLDVDQYWQEAKLKAQVDNLNTQLVEKDKYYQATLGNKKDKEQEEVETLKDLLAQKQFIIDEMCITQGLCEETYASTEDRCEELEKDKVALKEEVDRQREVIADLEQDIRLLYQKNTTEMKKIEEKYRHSDYKQRYKQAATEVEVHSDCLYSKFYRS